MNAQVLIPSLIGAILILAAGCDTTASKGEKRGRDAYANRDFDAAVSSAAASLRTKPDYRKSQELLLEVFPKAVESHLDAIKRAQAGSDEFKWDTIVTEYGKLIQVNDEVKSLPNLIDKKTKQPIHFDFRDYTAELTQAKTNAAEAHYQAGNRLFGKDGMVNRDKAAQEFKAANSYIPNYKDASALAAEGYYQEGLLLAKNPERTVQKQAAKCFKTAQGYVAGYKDTASLYEDAKKKGVTRMAIIPFQDKSGTGGRYGAVADMIVDQVVSEIMNDPSATEFLEIITRDKLAQVLAEQKLAMEGITDVDSAAKAGKLLAVHEILTGQLTQVAVTPERTSQSNIPNSARVAVGTQRAVGNDGKEYNQTVWQDVSAMLTVYTRTASASISGSCTLIDVETGKLKTSHQLGGNYAFQSKWGRFSGDERALTPESRSMASKNETMPPGEAEMVNSAIKDLVGSLSSGLKQDVR